MIDLHTHTNCSDGADDVLDLLKNAEKRKIEVLSITDHNTCMAYERLKGVNVRDYFTGVLIPGCELRTVIDGYNIEILGYKVNTDLLNQELPKIMPTFAQLNVGEATRFLEILISMGYEIDENNIKFDPETQSGNETIVMELLKNPKNVRFLDIFPNREYSGKILHKEHITNPKSPFFVDSSSLLPDIKTIIDLIHRAGGLVFVPHVFAYGNSSATILEKLLNTKGIDGIECFYSDFSDEQTNQLLQICKQKGYYVSGGTDYHGANRKGVELGVGKGNMNIGRDTIENWMHRQREDFCL